MQGRVKRSKVVVAANEQHCCVPVERLGDMGIVEECLWVEEKNGSKLLFSKRYRYGINGRGNPLLSRRKIRTMEDLEKKSRELFGI